MQAPVLLSYFFSLNRNAPPGDSNCKRPRRAAVQAYPSEPRAGMSPDENWTPESNLTTAGMKALFGWWETEDGWHMILVLLESDSTQ
ncbi:hypothetical protein Daesc_006667 [Daldinia eschscholtzii]|uniref:Uncharacterized protein n=1 Tax=Daldinia eschscholtzii TaxID=292717 RepID=A0AAX6MHP5_9PEZI